MARLEGWLEDRGADRDSFWAYQNMNTAGLAAMERMGDLVASEAGLTYAGWRLLWLLAVVGQSEPRRIAATLTLSRPAVVNGLNTLQRLGYISRASSLPDRRLVAVEITAEGREVVEKLMPATLALQTRIMACLTTEEKRQLASLTRRVADAALALRTGRPGLGIDDA
jgi:DNA-binding MarR family transcriptional regulator